MTGKQNEMGAGKIHDRPAVQQKFLKTFLDFPDLSLSAASETGRIEGDPGVFAAAPCFAGGEFERIVADPADPVPCRRI